MPLTAKGDAKIAAIMAAATAAMEIGIARETADVRRRIAQRAPDPAEEAEIVSSGEAVGAGTIGTPEAGRFQRLGGEVSLREAIETDIIEVESTGLQATGATGSAARINVRTSFEWSTRSRGIQGPSFPWNHHYVEAMEYGGTWLVLPRGHWALEPEPGVVASKMIKTLPPRHMFTGEKAASAPQMRSRMVATIRDAVRSEGFV